MYRTIVIGYTPKAKEPSKKIEEKASEMQDEDFSLVTFSVAPPAKTVHLFRQKEQAVLPLKSGGVSIGEKIFLFVFGFSLPEKS